MGSKLKDYAEREFDILEKTVEDPIILPFKNEIIALADKFGDSGQSGGSAPYVASAITQAIQSLLMVRPICPITGIDEEWREVSLSEDEGVCHQNIRCSPLFKSETEKPYFIDAIVFQGENEYDTWTGSCYIDDKDFVKIHSFQEVNFPFEPKHFFLEVLEIPITEQEAEEKKIRYSKDDNGNTYYTVLKDPSQLDEVFKYYNRKEIRVY